MIQHNKNSTNMSEEQKKQLEQQFWNIANTLRGKMSSGSFGHR